MQSNRRDFLKLSAAGAAAASMLGGSVLLSGCSSPGPAAGFSHLRAEDVSLLRALMPAVLRGSLQPGDDAALDATVASFDQMLDSLSPQVVAGVRQALDLMELGLARGLATGQWSGWEGASREDAESALLRLRDSGIEVLCAIYAALVRLIVSAWYGMPGPMAETGYPGPPTKVSAAMGSLDTHGIGAMPAKQAEPSEPNEVQAIGAPATSSEVSP